MFENLRNGYPLERIRLEHPVQKILSCGASSPTHVVFPIFDELEHSINIFFVEGEFAEQHGVKSHSATPNVDLSSIICLPGDDLGGSVVWRPSGRMQRPALLHQIGKTEVRKFDIIG